MSPILKQNIFPIRTCLNCGSWMNLRTFFCERCHRQSLVQFRNETSFKIENLNVRSLFRWPPGESDALSALVLQMKEEPISTWKIWALEFIHNLDKENLSKPTLLVSSESTSGKKHAQNFAQALSKYLGYPHLCPLAPKRGYKNQRELNRQERSQRELQASVEFSKPRDTRIIFVDDVVTTGKTAQAAYRALKEPSDFEVWSLIYREL